MKAIKTGEAKIHGLEGTFRADAVALAFQLGIQMETFYEMAHRRTTSGAELVLKYLNFNSMSLFASANGSPWAEELSDMKSSTRFTL